jgi:hypothetical protein
MFTSPLTLTSAACAIILALGGCTTPKGGFMPYSGGPQTYYSTEMSPKSVTLIDTRTGEELFALDIPVGKQLVVDFDETGGDDPVKTPALMRYEIMELGRQFGRTRNSLTVPGQWSRRLDLTIRKPGEIAAPPPELAIRTDAAADRPDWWTPKGGPMPVDDGSRMYDN